ncbi:MAG: lipopolysaccharide biosynthesis protein [Actinomycetales bacterium]
MNDDTHLGSTGPTASRPKEPDTANRDVDGRQPAGQDAERPVDGTDRSHLRRAARAGGLNVVGAVVGALCGFAVTAVITNGLGPDDAGTIFATTSLFLIGVAVVGLGTDIGLVRWMPTIVVTGRTHQLGALLRVAGTPVLAVSLLVAAICFTVAGPLADWVIKDDSSSILVAGQDQIKILAIFLPIAAGLEFVLAATRGLRTMRPTVIVEGISRSLVQIGAVAVALLLGASTPVVVLAWSLPYLPALGWAMVWLRRLLARARANPEPAQPQAGRGRHRRPGKRSGDAELAGAFWSFTGPRAMASIAQQMLKRLDVVLVAALVSPGEAALYAAASRFVTVGQVGVQAIQQALGPQLSALFARDQRQEAQEVYQTSTAWSMLMAWPVYLGCAALAGTLLAIFGPQYTQVTSTVVVLCLAMLFAIACGPVDMVLLMAGRSWLSLMNTFVALGVNLGLNLVLIPRWGALGAGCAWAGAIIVRNLLPLIQVRRHLGMSPIGGVTAKVGLQVLLTCAVVPGALAIAQVSAWYVFTALVVGGLVLLALMWRQRKELHLNDLVSVVRRRARRS